MPLRRYLPSSQLTSIVLSLALSVGVVFAADAITHHTQPPASVGVASDTSGSFDENWQTALAAIQAAEASSSIAGADPTVVQNLLAAAQSSNVTDTIGKSLLINLTNAKSQGLGNDIPTQDQIIAAAAAQLKSAKASAKVYTTSDLSIVPTNSASLRSYGNAFITALSNNPSASEKATLLSIDYAVEAHDASAPKELAKIGSAYSALGRDLAKVPVPQTLAPLHLQAVNDMMQISATYDDMQTIDSDSLRGLQGLQAYESLMNEEARVLTEIAQTLSKNDILFTKDEPGALWAGFLSP